MILRLINITAFKKLGTIIFFSYMTIFGVSYSCFDFCTKKTFIFSSVKNQSYIVSHFICNVRAQQQQLYIKACLYDDVLRIVSSVTQQIQRSHATLNYVFYKNENDDGKYSVCVLGVLCNKTASYWLLSFLYLYYLRYIFE